jgi:sec-independent protein translocase protein TatC
MSRRDVDPEGRMPLLEHLRELRSRLLKAALAIMVGTFVGWLVFDPVWNFLQKPFCRLDISHRQGGAGSACGLYVNGLTEGFFLQMKIWVVIGVLVSAPFWLYQLWAFIAPGLHRREKRWTYLFLVCAVPLFAAGAALAYVTLDKGLNVLLGFVPEGAIPIISISSYLGYMIAMLFIFGASFEIPLVVVILNLAGVVKYEHLKKHHRSLIFAVFIFAAVATPSQDPITMLVLAVPVLLLFELALVIAYFNDKRLGRDEPLYEGLDDDETSVIEETPTPVDGPSPIDVP